MEVHKRIHMKGRHRPMVNLRPLTADHPRHISPLRHRTVDRHHLIALLRRHTKNLLHHTIPRHPATTSQKKLSTKSHHTLTRSPNPILNRQLLLIGLRSHHIVLTVHRFHTMNQRIHMNSLHTMNNHTMR